MVRCREIIGGSIYRCDGGEKSGGEFGPGGKRGFFDIGVLGRIDDQIGHGLAGVRDARLFNGLRRGATTKWSREDESTKTEGQLHWVPL